MRERYQEVTGNAIRTIGDARTPVDEGAVAIGMEGGGGVECRDVIINILIHHAHLAVRAVLWVRDTGLPGVAVRVADGGGAWIRGFVRKI